MNSYNNPFYKSLLGISEIDNLSSAQINTQNLTISSLGTGLVSSASGTLQNAVIGTGLNFAGNTISNSGVTSLTGTSNQVLASASTGSVTLSLPQSIATTSSPSFAGLTIGTLSGILKATAGVVSGSSTTDDLTEGKTNLYFTNARARFAISSSTGITYNNITGIITNSGVLSLTGTADQVIASASTGGITLSLPQSIATSSSPQFARLLNSSISSNCVLLGTSSGSSLTSGVDLTAVGSQALSTLSTAINCTAIGSQALLNCNANNNTAVGYKSSFFLTSGFQNTTLGSTAGYSNTTGNYNTLIGMGSGFSLSTATNNVCMGLNSGYNITTSSDNISIGSWSMGKNAAPMTLTNGRNVAIGYYSAYSLEGSPSNNISIGYQSLWNANSCSDNISIGTNSGVNISTGGGNTILGTNAGSCITTGTFNVALGAGCLGGSGGMNTIDAVNVALGKNALYSCATTAINNFAVGNNTLQSLTTGNNNISIGLNSLQTLTTGSGNIYMGPSTTPSAITVSNESVLNVSGTAVTGKGTGTMFLNATAGLFGGAQVPTVSGSSITPLNNANGSYVTLFNGVILMWFRVAVSWVTSTTVTVNWTFPVAFPNGAFYCTAAMNSNSAGAITNQYTSLTTTGVIVYLYNNFAGVQSGTAVVWAIGC